MEGAAAAAGSGADAAGAAAAAGAGAGASRAGSAICTVGGSRKSTKRRDKRVGQPTDAVTVTTGSSIEARVVMRSTRSPGSLPATMVARTLSTGTR